MELPPPAGIPPSTVTLVMAPQSLDIYTAAGLREELREAIEQPGVTRRWD